MAAGKFENAEPACPDTEDRQILGFRPRRPRDPGISTREVKHRYLRDDSA